MKFVYALSAASLLALSACNKKDAPTQMSEAETESPHMGHNETAETSATLESGTFSVMNSSGFDIGQVTITDSPEGVTLGLDVIAIPEGSHAIHFHEVGTCDGPDFTTAGGHYNPASKDHGFDTKDGPHAGDMRNFEAPQSGIVKTEIQNGRVSLSERADFAPLLDRDGTALIIHASADDYKSQPSGAAGARIACAVLTKS